MIRRAIATLAALAALPAATAQAAAGELDPGFDDDGRAVLPFAGSPLSQALVQADGKIVLVGTRDNQDFAVWRVLPDGAVDREFGEQGLVTVDFGEADFATSAALQRDGGIVLAGLSETGTALARLTPNGSLDATFDGDGRVVLSAGPALPELVPLRDGTLALLESTTPGSGDADLAVARVRPDGSVDREAFEAAELGGYDVPAAGAAAPDGRLVVLASTDPPGEPGPVMSVVRYLADGRLDPAFGQGGRATLAPGLPYAVLAQPDGRVVVVARAASGRAIAVTRLAEDGTLDQSYGLGGTARAGFVGPPSTETAVTAALQGDGKVLVAGTGAEIAFAASRLTAAGALDPAFGIGGTTVVDFAGISVADASALQSDGGLVLAGATLEDLRSRMAVARLLGDPAPGGGPPAPGPPADHAPPVLSHLRVAPARLTPGARPRIRFRLSEPARVRFAVLRRGRGGRYRTVPRGFAVAARAGASRVRLPRRRLGPGRYRLVATPVDRAGNAGRPRRADFHVHAALRAST